eukprot:TRINITY_DN28930_c0_g1_i1.p1 TRINITY_DN28930_c0_g1~~TRINITY_DN28930_c0_g1_i1.p1  ORF type:complete len:658 (+),score=111.66 TRINITY_DN28930_c0_g1_i1:133-2106(+)
MPLLSLASWRPQHLQGGLELIATRDGASKVLLVGATVAATAVVAKTCWDVAYFARTAWAIWGTDARLPLRQPRPTRAERDEALKRGPKHLASFMTETGRPDAIVIGSGIGGLTCAALLARSGKRVLVLEQHDVAGGCLHCYAAGGYEWDVGIHYVGEVGGPGIHRAFLEQLTQGQLEWSRQDDPYDVTYIPKNREEGLRGNFEAFRCHSGMAQRESELCERFPQDAKAFRRVFRDLRKHATSGVLFILPKVLPRWLAYLICPVLNVLSGGFYTRLGTPLTTALEERGVQDPVARAVFSYPWGDLGNLPSTLPYGIMLGLHGHFMRSGAYFPVGGAAAIAHTIVEGIRAKGGEVLVRCNVDKVLVKNGRAYGVALSSGKEILVSSGGHVVAGVTLQTLYDKLLRGQQVPRRPACVQEGGCLREGLAAMSLFVGLENSGAELGIDSIQENAWAYHGPCFDEDFEAFFAQSAEDVIAGKKAWPGIFVGFPSSKDPSWKRDFPGKSSVTVVTLVNWAWFAPYEASRVHKRGAQYDVLKDAIAKAMWAFACEVYPQLKGATIGHFEAGSPLSNNYYIGSNKGEIYGADHNSERFSLRNLIDIRPSATGIKGLSVAGQDVLCGGFAGGLFAGCLSAGDVLGSWPSVWAGAVLSGLCRIPGFDP